MDNPIKADYDDVQPTLQTGSDEDQYLTFKLEDEMFAVGILNIREIIEYGDLTSVPMMPDFVRGVINLRGQVVPVIDLQVRFGREHSTVGKRSCIVIVEVEFEAEHHVIGIMVDAVSEVLNISDSDIERAPAFGARLRTEFISGMGKINGEFVIILDVDHALSVTELAAIVETGESQPQAVAV